MLKILHAQRNIEVKRPAKSDYSIAHCCVVIVVTLPTKLQMPIIIIMLTS